MFKNFSDIFFNRGSINAWRSPIEGGRPNLPVVRTPLAIYMLASGTGGTVHYGSVHFQIVI